MNNRDLVNCKSSLDGRERYLVQKYDMPTVSEGHIELHRPHKAYLGLFREISKRTFKHFSRERSANIWSLADAILCRISKRTR